MITESCKRLRLYGAGVSARMFWRHAFWCRDYLGPRLFGPQSLWRRSFWRLVYWVPVVLPLLLGIAVTIGTGEEFNQEGHSQEVNTKSFNWSNLGRCRGILPVIGSFLRLLLDRGVVSSFQVEVIFNQVLNSNRIFLVKCTSIIFKFIHEKYQ